MSDWQRVESATSDEGLTIVTVFDGDGVVSIELLDTEAAVTAAACAEALGFGTVFEPA